jgi:hypothetical protein
MVVDAKTWMRIFPVLYALVAAASVAVLIVAIRTAARATHDPDADRQRAANTLGCAIAAVAGIVFITVGVVFIYL